MMDEALRVVKAKTVPILVPADAEMVIEGKILPDVRAKKVLSVSLPATQSPKMIAR